MDSHQWGPYYTSGFPLQLKNKTIECQWIEKLTTCHLSFGYIKDSFRFNKLIMTQVILWQLIVWLIPLIVLALDQCGVVRVVRWLLTQ
jgi:hypothetical protein